MKKKDIILLSKLLLSNHILQTFLGGDSFLTGGGGLSVLGSIMSKGIRYYWVYRKLLAT